LSAAGEADAPAARAVVHCAAGIVDVFVEEYARALVHTESGLALLAAVDDAGARARCLLLSAMILILTGRDLAAGREHARQALEAARSCTDPLGQAWALVNLSMVEALCDRLPAARDAYSEFLTFPDACAHARLRTWAEDAAAWTELMAGAPERALAHADLALQLEGEAPSMTRFQLAGFRIQALALLGRSDLALREGHHQLTLARQTRSLQSIPAIEMALAVAEFMCGDLGAAEELARRLLGVPQLHSQALSRELLGRIALASGDVAQAEAHGRELRVIAQRTGSDRHHQLARFIGGSAAVLAGDIDRGRSLLQATLAATAELGVDGVTVDALTALAVLATRTRDPLRGARLAGAAHAARARLARVAPQSTVEQVAAVRRESIERDGPTLWDDAWAEGQQLSLADAVSYARRGRGRRNRPASGWHGLTPAERDVAALAANGLSNPQIASRLFISRATVKMHLSNVYAKLHVANRTELAGATAKESAASGLPGA
jgi:DNA-binding CsgD family transcriptional regulator